MGHFSWQPVSKGIIGTVICPFKPATANKPQNTSVPIANPNVAIPNVPPPVPQPPVPQPPPMAPQAPIFDPTLLQAKNAIAGPYQVPLEIGDLVYILEEYTSETETGGWLRGYVYSCSSQFTSKPLIGIFPLNYVNIGHQNDYSDDEIDNPTATHLEGENADHHDSRTDNNDLSSPLPQDNIKEALFYNNQTELNDSLELKSKKLLGNSSDLRMRAWMMKKHIHQPLPASIEPTHISTAGQDEILVDEIAYALREWGGLLKKYLKQQKYDLFNTVRELFQILFQVLIIFN